MIHAIVDHQAAQAIGLDASTLERWEKRQLTDRLAQLHEAAQAGLDPRDSTVPAPALPWIVVLAKERCFPVVSIRSNAASSILARIPPPVVEGQKDTKHGETRQGPIYGDWAAPAFERGYVPIPIPRGQKGPDIARWNLRAHPDSLTAEEQDQLRANEWVVLSDNHIESETLMYDRHNLGILLGHRLIAIDVDLSDEAEAKLIENVCRELGWWSAVRIGAKGFCLLLQNGWVDKDGQQAPTDWNAVWGYRHEEYKLLGNSAPKRIEILTGPRQVVWPPSIHPDGPTYREIGPDSLFDTGLEDLPVANQKNVNLFCKRAAEVLGLTWSREDLTSEAAPRSHGAQQPTRKAAHVTVTDEQLMRCSEADLCLLPQAIPVWLAEIDKIRNNWAMLPLNYFQTQSGVWKFAATWRQSTSSTGKYGRTDWNRPKSVSLRPWDAENDPNADRCGIRDHALPHRAEDSSWTVFQFCLRLLTEHDQDPANWLIDVPAARDVRRRVMEILNNSTPELARRDALVEAAVAHMNVGKI